MKITIFSAGSRGDIQPCIALGKGLQQAGYDIRLAAPENFADFVTQQGLGFYPLRGDVQAIIASDTGREFMETGSGNPLRTIRAVRTLIAPVVNQLAQDAHAACADAEELVCLGVFSSFGQAIRESLGIPMINVEPTPLLPSRAFPSPSWPIQRNLGGLHNFLSGLAMMQVVWLWYRSFVKYFRHSLGLSRFSALRYYRTLRSTPMVSLYSPTIIPHPPDRPDSHHITGYVFLDPQEDWRRFWIPAIRRSISGSAAWPAGNRRNWPGSPWRRSPKAASGGCC